MSDLPTPPATKLLKRGNWRNPAKEELAPGFLSTIDDRDAAIKPTENTPGRRAALANWIASNDNPLTARVIVNRLWQHHFGRGIVASSGDFGVTGDRPTHPELLDWLATELTAKGWSLKHIHRLMVTSAAYKQSAKGDAGAKLDPDNALLWHFPGRRLDGEALRDAMLAVSGRLNPKAGGPSVFPEIPPELKAAGMPWKVTADAKERDRRSVYVFVKRNLRYPLFALFDAPDRNETCSRRFVTTTAPQALTLLNDPLVLGFAKSFAARVTKEAGTDPAKVIDRAYLLALGRAPKPAGATTIARVPEGARGTSDEAVADLCHAPEPERVPVRGLMDQATANRWLRFSDPSLQARLVEMSHEFGASCSTDEFGRLWFDDDEWRQFRDPHLLTLDERFGPDWVAVYADKPDERQQRVEELEKRGIPYVVWFSDTGTFLVLVKVCCPADWEWS